MIIGRAVAKSIYQKKFYGEELYRYIANLKIWRIRYISVHSSVFTPNLWTKSSIFPIVFAPQKKAIFEVV